MGYHVPHRRMKPKAGAPPNARERWHGAYVRRQPCFGCGRNGSEAHHTLLRIPGKRGRRDHRWQLPVCPDCHRGPRGIHGIGSEPKWLESIGRTEAEAESYMECLWAESEAA